MPPGEYELRAWHPELRGQTGDTARRLAIGDAVARPAFALDLKRVWKIRRAPAGGDGGARY